MISLHNDDIFEHIDPDQNTVLSSLHNLCKNYSLAELNDLNLNTGKLSLLNYNVRSFHRNNSDFFGMLESLELKFKIIVLTETWNNINNVQLCTIPDYDIPSYYQGHGGVSVFCDSTVKAEINNSLSICHEDIEACVVDFTHKTKSYTIIAVYRPPQGSK